MQPKVFGIGLHKTGTTSLGLALQYLGYRVHGYSIATSRSEAKRQARKRCQEYDALQDMPWPVLYRWLDESYPNSKFILTTRPEEDWIDSVCRHFGGGRIEMHEWIYGEGDPLENRNCYLDTYRRHNKEVIDYFGDRRGEDLLVMDITSGEGWEKLCPFLGFSQPWLPFPRGRLSEKRLGEMRPLQRAKWRTEYICQRIVIHYRQGRLAEVLRRRLG